MRKPVNGVLVSEYEPYFTCHDCGLPIDETEGVVIKDNFMYHPNHQPAVRAVATFRNPNSMAVAVGAEDTGDFDW